jgi:L-histidine Nalpha-methyltransferase
MSLALRFYNLLSGLEAGNLGPEMYVGTAGLAGYGTVTHDPDYYPARGEKALWRRCAETIASRVMPGLEVVEFGPGDREEVGKIAPAVEAMQARRYIAFDYSGAAISEALSAMRDRNKDLPLGSVRGDFWSPLAPLPQPANGIAAGISAGNLPLPLLRRDPTPELAQAIGQWAGALGGGALIFTADMKLPNLNGRYYTRAYRHECHAAFNLGVLHRVAEETDARNFDPRRFGYRAVFNEAGAQVGHMAVSEITQRPVLAGERFRLGAGEALLLQSSFKLRPRALEEALRRAGVEVLSWIADDATPLRLYVVRCGLVPEAAEALDPEPFARTRIERRDRAASADAVMRLSLS